MARKPKYAVIPDGQFNAFPVTRRSLDDPHYRGVPSNSAVNAIQWLSGSDQKE